MAFIDQYLRASLSFHLPFVCELLYLFDRSSVQKCRLVLLKLCVIFIHKGAKHRTSKDFNINFFVFRLTHGPTKLTYMTNTNVAVKHDYDSFVAS